MRGKFIAQGLARQAGTGFNEARALCAGSSDEGDASRICEAGFNEARALCAGSSPTRRRTKFRGTRFNEARALCAGSWPGFQSVACAKPWLQ